MSDEEKSVLSDSGSSSSRDSSPTHRRSQGVVAGLSLTKSNSDSTSSASKSDGQVNVHQFYPEIQVSYDKSLPVCVENEHPKSEALVWSDGSEEVSKVSF